MIEDHRGCSKIDSSVGMCVLLFRLEGSACVYEICVMQVWCEWEKIGSSDSWRHPCRGNFDQNE